MHQDEAQYAFRQMQQKKLERERIALLEEKVQKIIQNQREIEENDFAYEKKMKELDDKRILQLGTIKNLKETQQSDLQQTAHLFQDLYNLAQDFQSKQVEFVMQQKRDRDMLKQYNKTKIMKQTSIDQNQEIIQIQNPFFILSKTQGMLDSQCDQLFQDTLKKYEEIYEVESNFTETQIIISFISYKPDIPSSDIYQARLYQGVSQQIPLQFHFLIDFYDFPCYQSKTIIYEDHVSVEDIRESIIKEQDLKLINEEFYENKSVAKKPTFNFTVDTSDEFLYYMLFKQVQVRVIDSVTGELYGYLQIPLRECLRQGASQKSSLQECQIVSFDWTVTNGIYLVSITNIGKNVEFPTQTNLNLGSTILDFGQTYKSHFIQTQELEIDKKEIDDDERKKLRISKVKFSNSSSIFKKSKIISEKPKSVIEHSKKSIINQRIQDVPKRLRYKTKIQAVKKDYLHNLSIGDEFQRSIAIQYSKEWNKQEYVKQVLISQLRDTLIEVNLRRGQKIYKQLNHTCSQSGKYQLEITNQNLCFIALEDEQQYIYTVEKIPMDQQIIMDQKQNIIMEKGQDYTIILVFYSKQEIQEIELCVYLKYQSVARAGQLYQIKRESPIIDLTLEYYQRPNFQIIQRLPPLYCFCEVEFQQTPIIVIDNEQCTIKIDEQYFLYLKLRTPDVCETQIVFIYIYRDIYKYSLLYVLQVIIHTLPTLELTVSQGKVQTYELEFESDIDRVILIHSLNKSKLWLETPYNKQIQVKANAITKIPIKLCQMTEKQGLVQVSVIDQSTNQFIYGWLLYISTTMLEVNYIFPIECHFRKVYHLTINYTNKSDVTLNLTLTSADILVKVIQQHYKVLQYGVVQLKLLVQKGEEYPNQELKMIEQYREIKLFVFDLAHQYTECILLQIKFHD